MKRFLLAVSFLLLLASPCWAATKYARAAGGNWSADATWSTTSGGAADTTKCVNGDACLLDANSGNVTVDASSAATSIDCTGYTGTLTISASMQLAIAGNLKFVSGMTFTDNSTTGIVITATNTSFDSGGKALGALTFQNVAVAFVADATITGLFTPGSGNITGAYNLYCQGDVNVSNFATWEPTINFTGSSNQEWQGGTGQNYNAPTVINKSGGTLTISGTPYVGFANKPVVITYTAGTVSHTGTLGIRGTGSSVTLNTNGMTWNNIDFGSFETPTITLSSLLSVSGTITVVGNTTLSGTGGIDVVNLTINSAKSLSAGGNQINVSGNWTNNGTFTANTSTVVFDGAATHVIDGSTAFYSLTCGTGETCTFDDADTFSTNASGVLAGDGTWQSDLAGTTTDLNVNGTETIASGICHDVTNAGTTIVTSGTLDNCSGWSNSSSAVKTVNGLAIASVKTKDGLAIASIKNFNGLA